MSRPRVTTKCVADNYAANNERIIEVGNGSGGCLISLRTTPGPDGVQYLAIEIYRADPNVHVISASASVQTSLESSHYAKTLPDYPKV